MAARGSFAKEEITKKLLEVFDNAFLNGKEIRIPMEENGAEVQIKVTLTAAKENIGIRTEPITKEVPWETASTPSDDANTPKEPTDDEKENLKKLMASLF